MGSTGRVTTRKLGEVKTFLSRPISGHEYSDDKGATAQWFKENSNVDEVIAGMNRETRDAFHFWSQGYFMFGQQWGGWSRMGETEREYTKAIDAAIDKSVINSSVELSRLSTWRLLNNGSKDTLSLDQVKNMEGQIIYVKGAMSTAAAEHGLSIDWRSKTGPSKPVEYKIIVPAGSKGAGMWIGDKRINGWGDKQREFIMNRDSYYKVGKSHYDSKRGKTIVELIWSGVGQHSYK